MNILILGGTGSIGSALIDLLRGTAWNIYVTSRTRKESSGNITFIQGNGHDEKFIQKCAGWRKWDAIIDFMAYSTQEFAKKIDIFLESTDQYFFLSSSRVYTESEKPIKEDSPRLLDTCNDEEYLKTDEYALAKARQENLLFASRRKNWTIIRPYKTYNSNRLQLGMFEKEDWLYRLMMGKTLVFPSEIAKKRTTLTYAADVAVAIKELVGNQAAYGEAFHITTAESVTWQDVLDEYMKILQNYTGEIYHIKYVNQTEKFYDVWNRYQIRYDCIFDRRFDNSKIDRVTNNKIYYTQFSVGCKRCLEQFLEFPVWRSVN